MRSAPSAVQTGLMNATYVWRADLYTVTLVNPPAGVASVLYFTSADVDLNVSGVTYACGAVLRRGNIRQSARLEVDALDVELAGSLLLGARTLSTWAALGLFDDARVRIDHLVSTTPLDVSWGPVPSFYEGRVAGAEPSPTTLRLTVKSEVEALDGVLPKFLFSSGCMHAVYDANCGVSRAAFTSSGSVTGTPSASAFNSNLTSHADNYYNLGVLTFNGNVTAALVGVRRAVQAYATSAGLFTLAQAAPVSPANGDTFSVYPGCSRLWTTCLNVFANTAAFRGFPHIPDAAGGQ